MYFFGESDEPTLAMAQHADLARIDTRLSLEEVKRRLGVADERVEAEERVERIESFGKGSRVLGGDGPLIKPQRGDAVLGEGLCEVLQDVDSKLGELVPVSIGRPAPRFRRCNSRSPEVSF
jgi:hypothetical protein